MRFTDKSSDRQKARSWSPKSLRALGLTGIAAVAAVSIAAIIAKDEQAPEAQTTRTAPTLTPPAPARSVAPSAAPLRPTFIESLPNGGVKVHNPHEAMSITVTEANGVRSTTTHHLGGGYQYSVEFLRLLKERDPKLYAWVNEQRHSRDTYNPMQQSPDSVVVGETDYGQEIVAGQTLVVPLKRRTAAEIEKDYKDRYEWTRTAYVMAQARKKEGERVQKRLAEQAKAKGIPLDEYIAQLSKQNKSKRKTSAK